MPRPRPLAWRPGLAVRSPGWRGAPLSQTDSEKEETDAQLHQDSGRAGVQGQGGGGRETETSETLNPAKVQGLCRFPPGEARSEAELRAPLLRQRDLGGEGDGREPPRAGRAPSPSYNG